MTGKVRIDSYKKKKLYKETKKIQPMNVIVFKSYKSKENIFEIYNSNYHI